MMLGTLLFYIISLQFVTAFISSAINVSAWTQFGMHALSILIACVCSYFTYMAEKALIENDEDY